MSRKSSKPTSQDVEASQEAPAEETRRSITKVGAVKAALRDGSGAPEAGVAFIKSRFGLDITRQHFSAIKSQLKRREGETQGVEPAARGRRPSAPRPDSPPPARLANGENGLLEALEVMKPLVDQLGAEKVKRLVELLD